MQLKWTSKALSDLARLYEFLAPVNRPAAARAVQALSKAPTIPGLPQLRVCRWPSVNDVHDQSLAAPLFTSRCFV